MRYFINKLPSSWSCCCDRTQWGTISETASLCSTTRICTNYLSPSWSGPSMFMQLAYTLFKILITLLSLWHSYPYFCVPFLFDLLSFPQTSNFSSQCLFYNLDLGVLVCTDLSLYKLNCFPIRFICGASAPNAQT